MKTLGFLLTLCLAGTVTLNAQTGPDRGVRMVVGEDALHARLRLETDIVEQQNCASGRLHFSLRLTFKNAGQQPVILDKRSSVVPAYMVSRTPAAAAAKKYELVGRQLIDLKGAGVSFAPTLDRTTFATIKPGESYSLVSHFSLPVTDGKEDDPDSLRAGNYVLQIVVLTWYYPQVSNVGSREQWRDEGYLWSDPVTSLPMPFTVDKKRIGGCTP